MFKIYEAQQLIPSPDGDQSSPYWITTTYHKTIEGAARSLDMFYDPQDFPLIPYHHGCFGNLSAGYRIWEVEVEGF